MTLSRPYVDAWRAGERARDHGRSPGDNPYPRRQWQQRFLWDSGWHQRDRMIEVGARERAKLQEQKAFQL